MEKVVSWVLPQLLVMLNVYRIVVSVVTLSGISIRKVTLSICVA